MRRTFTMALIDCNITERWVAPVRKFLLAGGIATISVLLIKGLLIGVGEFAGNLSASAIYERWSGAPSKSTSQLVNFHPAQANFHPENADLSPAEIFRPVEGVEYHLRAAKHYKLSLSIFEKRNIFVRKGAISVQYDGNLI